MAIKTASEQAEALQLALDTLRDVQAQLDSVPYGDQSEALHYERANVSNAIWHLGKALALTGTYGQDRQQAVLDSYKETASTGPAEWGQA